MNEAVRNVTSYDAHPQLRRPRRFLREAIGDLVQGTSLARALFRAALRTQRRRSLLGHLWLFLPAAAAAFAISYVQANDLIAIPDPGMPLAVFVFGGTVLWQLFLEALNAPSRQFMAHRVTVTRLQVPHEALVLAGLLEALLNFGVRSVALLALCLASGAAIGPWAVLAPLAALALLALGLAIGLILAPVTLLFEDGARGVFMATNFLVFAMPVAYPIPAAGLQRFNLMIPLIDTPRNWLVGLPSGSGFALAAGLSAGLLLLAWPFYRLARLHIVARLG